MSLDRVDGMYVYKQDSPQNNLWGYGETIEDVLRDLNENITFLWRMYAMENDDRLSDAAIELKRYLVLFGDEQTARKQFVQEFKDAVSRTTV